MCRVDVAEIKCTQRQFVFAAHNLENRFYPEMAALFLGKVGVGWMGRGGGGQGAYWEEWDASMVED